jgi:hypothetical protein
MSRSKNEPAQDEPAQNEPGIMDQDDPLLVTPAGRRCPCDGEPPPRGQRRVV